MRRKLLNYLHIEKSTFTKYKSDFGIFLDGRVFDMATLRWEHELSVKDIAYKYDLSVTRIKQLLARAMRKMLERGYPIEGWLRSMPKEEGDRP